MKKYMGTKFLALTAISVFVSGISFAGDAPFDTGGVKMVAPMKGPSLGCNVAGKPTPCNKAATPELESVVRGLKAREHEVGKDLGRSVSEDIYTRDNPYNDVARSVNDNIEGGKYQGRVEDYKEQLKSGVFKSEGLATGAYGTYDTNQDRVYSSQQPATTGVRRKIHRPVGATTTKEKVKVADVRLNSDERIYILISQSVPLETLRTYVKDIASLGTPDVRLVMRGFVGEGGMKNAAKTMAFIGEILNKDHAACMDGGDCDSYPVIVDIDPNIFRRFQPEVVPTIVYVKNVKPTKPDTSEGIVESVGELKDSDSMMLYGDLPLGYAFDLFAEKSGDERLKSIGQKLTVY